ncbi:MAG: hypothetical protein A2046_05975 [Bacteroidetes bacterium GWA2_30_7]|nr:MAG: hypothetical protein A2046_05975 [Bacteroidetes bacterium GWA2_30_7]
MNKISIIIVLIVFFYSCRNKEKTLPTITGKAGEVVVVIDNNLENLEAGQALKKILTKEVDALPQPEPTFDYINIPSNAFTNIFKTHRNIIICEINKSEEKGKIIVKKDVWARPQIFINIIANNDSILNKLITDNEKLILSSILDAENQRIVDNYTKYEDKIITKEIAKKYDISLKIPKGFSLDLAKDNFAWISHETPQISQGIFLYYYNYTDTNQFSKDSLIQVRDEFLKKYVPGPRENSYMSTEHNYEIHYHEFNIDSMYIARLVGLWKVEGDYMGGPFVSYSTPDIKRNRLITIEGYVYAPRFDKRNYIRQLEGILSTIKVL